MKLLNPSQAFSNQRLQTELLDDFTHLDATRWSTVEADSGASVAIDADGVGGLVLITTGATDNNEAYLYSSTEFLNYLASRPILLEWDLSYTEANTDDANVIAGMASGVAANLLQDDGAGPAASYTGAVFFKADGDTVWSVETSNAGSQTTTQTDVTAGGSQRLGIQAVPISSTSVDVTFWVDGVQCRDSDGKVIRHSVSITSASEMALVCGAKAGSANSEVITVDFVGAQLLR